MARARTLVRLAGALGASLGLLFVVEGAASALLAWRDAAEPGLAEEKHCAYDPLLGWSHVPGFRSPDLYGPGRGLSVNARGFRAREDYAREVPGGRYRVVCLGDSFTLGYGVDDDDTYPAALERLDARIQAVNMGQGGYGVDQCWLWYGRDGVELETDLLLLAFIAPDFERMAQARFQGEYAKPVLRVEDGRLVEPEPVPDDWSAGRDARRWRRFAERLALGDLFARLRGRAGPPPATSAPPEAWREPARLVVEDLARRSRERGQAFALVMLPLRDRRAGDPTELARWLAPLASSLDVPWLDLTADFDALPPGERDAYYQPDGHLNALGNAFVARLLHRRLGESVPGFPR